MLRNASSIEHQLGASDRAFELVDRSIAAWVVVGDDAGRADALRLRGAHLLDRGDIAAARDTLAEAVELARAVDDQATRRTCLSELSALALEEGDSATAEALLEELLEACSLAGDRLGIGIAHGNLAYALMVRGEVVIAESHAREAVLTFTEHGPRDYFGWSLMNLAGVLAEAGRPEEAGALALQALDIVWELGNVRDLAGCLENLSTIAIATRDAERALRLMTAAQRIRTEAVLPLGPYEQARAADRLERIREALGEDFDRVASSAAVLSTAEIVQAELAGRIPAAGA